MTKANRVMHFEIQADDVDRAKKFYEKCFDWEIKKWEGKEGEKPAEGGMMAYWLIMTGPKGTPGIDGGMYQRPADEKIYTYDCTISVEDIDEAVEAVKKNGGKIRTEKTGQEINEMPGVGWFATAIDPEGNKFGLMEPTDWQPE